MDPIFVMNRDCPIKNDLNYGIKKAVWPQQL